MEVADEQAIQSMIAFGARYRTVISWWLMENFRSVGVTPGFDHARPDRNALAIEVFAQYMAQLETLEMVYFALRKKTADPDRSFVECFLGIRIHEFFGKGEPGPYCGWQMLKELKGMTVERFERELGMPKFEELKTSRCGEAFRDVRASRENHEANILGIIDWMIGAVENKEHQHMHLAYMKIKHGFGVLGSPHSDDVYLMQSAEPVDGATCIAEVLPLNNTEEFLKILEDDTLKIAGLVIELLQLYLRRSPIDGCNHCKDEPGGCHEEVSASS